MHRSAAINLTEVRHALDLLHGASSGLVNIAHVDAAGRYNAGVFYPLDTSTGKQRARDAAVALDKAGAQSIYVRMTTLQHRPGPDSRGGADLSQTLPALWLDLDVEGPGHRHDPAKHDGRRLFPDLDTARAFVATTGLPEPSLWIHTGGGLYAWWLADRPLEVADRPGLLDSAATLSAKWHETAVRVAVAAGWHLDNTGDLARVLRLPGTVNRKITGQPTQCRIDTDTGHRYSWAELAAAADSALEAAPPMPARATDFTPSTPVARDADRGVDPGTDFAAKVDWADELLLGGLGWTVTRTRGRYREWRHPDTTSPKSATTGRDAAVDRLYVFSPGTVFPAETALDKFGAYTIIHFGGRRPEQIRQATKRLRELGYGDPLPATREAFDWSGATPASAPVGAQSPGVATQSVATDTKPRRPINRPEVDAAAVLAGDITGDQSRSTVEAPPTAGDTAGEPSIGQDRQAAEAITHTHARTGDVDPRAALDQAYEVFRRWLGDDYDLGALDAVLATAAVEQLGGDPCWLLLISGSGNAKTETVGALAGIGAHITSTIASEGALLSGTTRKERGPKATGGLLRKVGDRGIIVIKDFTTIISMNRDMRAQVLAALREVYDGRWERNVGTDGGQTLTWTGRLVVIGAVTTAYDSAHSVVASMGERFALLRMDSTDDAVRVAAGQHALANVGHEVEMRAELAKAAAEVLHNVNVEAAALTNDDMTTLLHVANLVTLARTAVERDHQGNIVDAHAPEMPTRFAKMLGQIVRGALAVGINHDRALRTAVRIAGDTIPPLRLRLLGDVLDNPYSTVADVVTRVQKPRTTVDRELQALHVLGLLTQTTPQIGSWRYSLAQRVDVDTLRNLVTRNVSTGVLGC